MIFFAYVDIRPILFLIGLPVFVLLWLFVYRCMEPKKPNSRIKTPIEETILVALLAYTFLFVFFLTGFGPFIDQTELREYLMTWEIKPIPSQGMKESEVVLSFVDFPGYHLGEYSDQLANHLRKTGKKQVKVVLKLTSDYGDVRAHRTIEIAGLKNWQSVGGYAGGRGSPEQSPWD